MSWIFVFLQIILAIIAVYILYNLALRVLFQDRLVVTDETLAVYSTKAKILDGYVDLGNLTELQFNTVNQNFESYIALPLSVNRKGGAQFAYSFWIFVNDVNAMFQAGMSRYTLFMRGDRQTYTVQGLGQNNVNIECPRVSFTRSMSNSDTNPDTTANGRPVLEIGYNTVGTPVPSTFTVNAYRNPDNTMRHNLLSLLPKKWCLMTVVMQDNMPLQDFENGLLIKVYVNDLLYDTGIFPNTSMKQNRGNLFIAPDGPAGITKTLFGNLTYYNYVPSDNEIAKTYNAGPPTKPYVPNAALNTTKLELSEYNKMDIYNV